MSHKNLKWVICALLVLAFALITFLVVNEKTNTFDTWVYNMVSKLNIKTIFLGITQLGDFVCIVLISLLVALIIEKKKYFIFIPANMLIITGINQLTKRIIRRERPILPTVMVEESGFSFPSGHTTAIVALLGYVIYIIGKSGLKAWIKALIITLISIVIFGVCVSRIYLGAHYATDVIGAIVFTLAYLIPFVHVTELIASKKNLN